AASTPITSPETSLEIFQRLSPSTDRINTGLVKITPRVSARAVAEEIKTRMWPVATALTRSDSAKAEKAFWLKVKPIGIMFTSGVMVAFAAGAVILYQVL